MIVRKGTLADVPLAAANGRVFAEAAYPDIPYDEESMAGCLQQIVSAELLIIAEDKGEIIGGVGGLCGPFFFNKNYKIGSEHFWWIHPDRRGGMTGYKLLKAIEAAAKEVGCDYWMMLALHDENLSMVDGFYTRTGYRLSEHGYLKRLA